MTNPTDQQMTHTKTDEMKIEEAAKLFSTKDKSAFTGIYLYYAFKAGVKWRDQNPSPAVEGMRDALNHVRETLSHMNMGGSVALIDRALAAYEAEMGKK